MRERERAREISERPRSPAYIRGGGGVNGSTDRKGEKKKNDVRFVSLRAGRDIARLPVAAFPPQFFFRKMNAMFSKSKHNAAIFAGQ